MDSKIKPGAYRVDALIAEMISNVFQPERKVDMGEILTRVNIQIEVQYVYSEVEPPSSRNPGIKSTGNESIRTERVVVTNNQKDKCFEKAKAALDILKIS